MIEQNTDFKTWARLGAYSNEYSVIPFFKYQLDWSMTKE